MVWFYLIMVGLLEIVWVFGLKELYGFMMLGWSFLMIVFLIVSFGLFLIFMKFILIGMVYVVFIGIGVVGIVIIGMIFFLEGVFFWKIVLFIVLLIGIIGLKLVDGNEFEKEVK